MNREKLYWVFQIVGWSLYGLATLMIYSFVQEEVSVIIYIGEVFQVGFYILSTHVLRLLIKNGDWISGSWRKLTFKVLASIMVMSVANYLFLLVMSLALGTINKQDFQLVNVFISIIAPSMMYFLWSLIYLTFHYFQWYNKSLQYEAAINEMELNYLKSQLNPHFIFNALNSIRALVDENPKKSKDAITHLSTILRNSLILDKKKLIPLSQEIKTVKDYLALETIRFEERLRTKFDVPKETLKFYVPPMMIQTLIENGIKHGISRLTKGGTIELKTEIQNNQLVIKIFNSGQYNPTEQKSRNSTGFGLENTQKRLGILYAGKAFFKIENVAEDTVLTQIRIPELTSIPDALVAAEELPY